MRELPKEVKKRLWEWRANHIILSWSHLILGLGVTAASVTIAATIHSISPYTLQWIAGIAAVCSGILTTFNPRKRANNFLNAWRHVTYISKRFEIDDSFPELNLWEAVFKAEQIIGNVRAEEQ